MLLYLHYFFFFLLSCTFYLFYRVVYMFLHICFISFCYIFGYSFCGFGGIYMFFVVLADSTYRYFSFFYYTCRYFHELFTAFGCQGWYFYHYALAVVLGVQSYIRIRYSFVYITDGGFVPRLDRYSLCI
jgi:hypothetical protein